MEKKAIIFEFTSYRVLANRQEIELMYAIDFEDGKRLDFEEKIKLSEAIPALDQITETALDKTLHTLHLMCGLSYWKTFCPPKMAVKTAPLTKKQAAFWSTVYTKGLGEFFYKNKLDFRELVQFPYSEDANEKPVELKRQDKALMAVGGGKDSIVTYELLKKTNIPVTAFLLETQKEYGLINDVVKKMDVTSIHIQRTIDPLLFQIEKLGGTYNGHIPITAIYSTIGLLCAVLYDFKYIILSNEKSANYGNVMYHGEEINHQWSKSEEFEQLFQTYIKDSISPDIIYFSLLRSWTEMRIVKEFINYPQYFSLFSSCNNNFKVYKAGLQGSKWCGICPKCAFVFSMLAAYLPKSEVTAIFNKNMYADESLNDLYRELLGIKDIKPFECIGTPDEVKAAFYKAFQKGEYKKDGNMKLFETEVLPEISQPQDLLNKAEETGNKNTVPELFKNLI